VACSAHGAKAQSRLFELTGGRTEAHEGTGDVLIDDAYALVEGEQRAHVRRRQLLCHRAAAAAATTTTTTAAAPAPATATATTTTTATTTANHRHTKSSVQKSVTYFIPTA
jgi:hypothetical protein